MEVGRRSGAGGGGGGGLAVVGRQRAEYTERYPELEVLRHLPAGACGRTAARRALNLPVFLCFIA